MCISGVDYCPAISTGYFVSVITVLNRQNALHVSFCAAVPEVMLGQDRAHFSERALTFTFAI